jgi:hypothetical protein
VKHEEPCRCRKRPVPRSRTPSHISIDVVAGGRVGRAPAYSHCRRRGLLEDQLVRFLFEREPPPPSQLPVHYAIRHACSLPGGGGAAGSDRISRVAPRHGWRPVGRVRSAPGRTSRAALSHANVDLLLTTDDSGATPLHRAVLSSCRAVEPTDDGHGSDLGGAAAPGASREGPVPVHRLRAAARRRREGRRDCGAAGGAPDSALLARIRQRSRRGRIPPAPARSAAAVTAAAAAAAAAAARAAQSIVPSGPNLF